MLLNVYAMSVSLEANHENGQHLELQMHLETPNETAMKSESITHTADTNRLESVQKEPKFFDEFECKYMDVNSMPNNYIIIISSSISG